MQNFVTERSLWQQDITFKERGAAGGKAATLIGITAWLYYRKIWAVPALIPLGIWLYREFLKEEKKKKEQEFQKQFREMIQSLSAALNTGYSVENAFYETQKELKILYPPEARISKELLVITRKLRIHIPVEQVLEEFAEQVLSEDVKSFVTVFVTAKKSGGDMIGIIRNTANQIGDKIEVKREIDTMLAAKKYEFQIMSVVPYGIIGYMSLSFPEFMNELYGNMAGIGVMTLCLGIYAGAYYLGIRIVRVTCVLFISGILLTGADAVRSVKQLQPAIERNDYGKGSKTEVLDVKVGDTKKKIRTDIEVSERRYTTEEIQELFGRIIRRMDRLILNENQTPDHVETDLNLITEIPGEPVTVSWELDRYDVMNVKGEIQEKNIAEKGTLVKLNAVLTYTENEKEQAAYQCVVCVYPKKLSGEEKIKKTVTENMKKADEKQREQETMILPERLGKNEIRYYHPFNNRGMIVLTMSIMIGILLCALQKQNEKKELEDRKKQMFKDYPDIINKLTLYLGAGMTVKRAWRKVTEGYAREKEEGKKRYAYEEMIQTCHEMDSGVTESESYENFGRRCDVQVYIRLGALLSQNLRKGTKGLTELLKLESIQAFEERKAQAKRLGEEAGTKLLLPMFLMLAVVLVIVIVPAFLTLQI